MKFSLWLGVAVLTSFMFLSGCQLNKPVDLTVKVDPAALKNFDGQFNFGWIGDDKQKNLGLDESDFLIEFSLNTEEITRSNLPDIGIVSKKPMGNQPGYSVALSKNKYSLVVRLNDDKREKLGEKDYVLRVPKFFKPGEWINAAVNLNRSARTVTIYKNSAKIKVFKNIDINHLGNHSAFMLGVGNMHNHIRFKGKIGFVRIWEFPNGVPSNIQDYLCPVDPKKDKLEKFMPMSGVNYSFWKMDNSSKGVEDLGNNGNFLYYMPENEDLRFEYRNEPAKADNPPKTIYVDIENPNASDNGLGTKEKPFKSIHRAGSYADAGDTVIVKKGVYRENIAISGGRFGLPIKLRAEKGAIVSGGEQLSGWKKTETNGLYVLKDWKGQYRKPKDPKKHDARKEPESIVFYDGAPLKWSEYVEDMIPGTYSIWPREKGKPKDVYIFPNPGEDPSKATVEMNPPVRFSVTDFIEVEGFHVKYTGISLSGEGCVALNNTVEWANSSCLGIYGGNHKIIGNKLYWGGNTGIGGGGASGCVFEKNDIRYADWRCFDPNWGGGGAKIIPSNIDNTVRENTFIYNWGAAFWYDAFNSGNLVEKNLIHDNEGHAGIFDEIDWRNTFQYNIVFNNWCRRQNRSGGMGIMIGESSKDKVYRNIVFNNERGTGICLRGYCTRKGSKSPEKVLHSAYKYPHHYVSAKRQKQWLDNFVKYFSGEYVKQVDTTITENIVFDNWSQQLWTMKDYRVKLPKDKDYSFESDFNIYYDKDPSKIVRTGSESLSLEEWQKLSNKDLHSKIINPYTETEKLPDWAKKLFDFKKHQFRSAAEIRDLKPDMGEGVGNIFFKARLARAKKYRKLKSADRGLRAYLMFLGSEIRMLALWRVKGAGELRLNVKKDNLIIEDQWLRRKSVKVENGKIVVFVGRDPIYIICASEDISIDDSFKGKMYDTGGNIQIPSAPGTITLDGDLAEWKKIANDALIAKIDTTRNVISDSKRKWRGVEDLSSKAYACWNPSGIYFAFEVTDDSPLLKKDSVEIFIDGREEWKHFFTEYEKEVYHINIPLADGKAEVIVPAMKKRIFRSKKHTPNGAIAAAKPSEKGYIIEVFIPWNKSNFDSEKLEKGRIIRIGFMLNDSDNNKEGDLNMKWNARRESVNETSGWIQVPVE